MNPETKNMTFWDFAKDHPWMTFFLLDTTICVAGNVIVSLINLARGADAPNLVRERT